MTKENVINLEAVYAPYFVEIDGNALQEVMDLVGYGEDTDGIYVRKDGEWVEPEATLEYQYKGDGEYLPGDYHSIDDDSFESALKLWDDSQKEGNPIYSKQMYPYLLENYVGTIDGDEG